MSLEICVIPSYFAEAFLGGPLFSETPPAVRKNKDKEPEVIIGLGLIGNVFSSGFLKFEETCCCCYYYYYYYYY